MGLKKYRVILVRLMVCALFYTTVARIHTRWSPQTLVEYQDGGLETAHARPVRVHYPRMQGNTTHARRQNLVARACGKLSPERSELSERELNQTYAHLLINDKYKTLYCYAPKVATTSWRFFLLNATHGNFSFQPQALIPDGPLYRTPPDVHDFSHWTSLYDLSQEERDKRLATYFKFMVVRHPLERLISAYRDKFEKSLPIYLWMAEEIKMIYRPVGVPDDPLVTFGEFLLYVSDLATIEARQDHHWSTFQDLCQPCFVKYDYIAKMETMEEDAERISNLLGMAGARLPKLRAQTHRRYRDYFENDTKEHYDMIVERFRVDLEMFGYKLEDEPRYFKGGIRVS